MPIYAPPSGGSRGASAFEALIALGILQTDRVSFAGVAPIMSYLADEREVITIDGLGHKIAWWPELQWRAGAVCAIRVDPESGILQGGADPRLPAYALGW